jgi:hypothetical protein
MSSRVSLLRYAAMRHLSSPQFSRRFTSASSDQVLPGYYKHYKSGVYKVLATVMHTETSEMMALYHAVNPEKKARERNPSNVAFVRPINIFNKNVLYKGTDVPRFRRLQPQPSDSTFKCEGQCSAKDISK